MLLINNLNKFYKKSKAISDINFNINEDEIVGLVGLNGEGKTTTIKSICNIIKPDFTSKITINGKKYQDPSSRQDLFYLPEKFQISYFLTGYDFLKISTEAYFKVDKVTILKDIEFYAKKLNFPIEKIYNKISTYSKGMCQKISLIAAFISKKKLLILDEPMSGLDILTRESFIETLTHFKSTYKSSILLSTHILNDLEKICNKIIVINKGQIIFFDKTENFLKQFNKNGIEKSFLEMLNNE